MKAGRHLLLRFLAAFFGPARYLGARIRVTATTISIVDALTLFAGAGLVRALCRGLDCRLHTTGPGPGMAAGAARDGPRSDADPHGHGRALGARPAALAHRLGHRARLRDHDHRPETAPHGPAHRRPARRVAAHARQAVAAQGAAGPGRPAAVIHRLAQPLFSQASSTSCSCRPRSPCSWWATARG